MEKHFFYFCVGFACFGMLWMMCNGIGLFLIKYRIIRKRIAVDQLISFFGQLEFPFSTWYADPETHGFRTKGEIGEKINPISRLKNVTWASAILDLIGVMVVIPLAGLGLYGFVTFAWAGWSIILIFWGVMSVWLIFKTLMFIRILLAIRQ